MNLREFYSKVKDIFGPDRVKELGFSDPTLNPTYGVQFINENGTLVGPVILPTATDIQYAKPLAGPFFDSTVIGVSLYVPSHFGHSKQLRAVVEDPEGVIKSTGVLQIRAKLSELKGLASELGIKWYYVDFSRNPWVYTEFSSFSECVEYARVHKDSIQSD